MNPNPYNHVSLSDARAALTVLDMVLELLTRVPDTVDVDLAWKSLEQIDFDLMKRVGALELAERALLTSRQPVSILTARENKAHGRQATQGADEESGGPCSSA